MFMHVFRYRLKCLLRNRELIFWTLLFPLVMATFFYFAFGHLTSMLEGFNPVQAVIVDNEAYRKDAVFRGMLDSLSKEGENQVLRLILANGDSADKLLKDGDVAGIITVGDGDDISLTVKQSGIDESILKVILDEYLQVSKTVSSIIHKNPGAVQKLIGDLGERRSYTQEVSFSDAMPDTMLAYFYALIAMACMYCSFWGLRNTLDIQADLSAQGARRSIAPTHKLKIVLADTSAALAVGLWEVLVLIAYLAFVLGISFGNQLGFVLLTCFIGCIAGISFGHFIATVTKGSEGLKVAILIGVSMIMSFLAGLMWVDMKYAISRKAPILSYINPAALISDAFYSLYIFDTYRRFFINIGMLCFISAGLSLISFIQLRRERYASI